MPIEFTHVPGGNSRNNPTARFFHDAGETAAKLSLIEDAGFQKIVVDDPAGLLTNMDLAASALDLTSSLEIALTHWAGVVAPTVAARQLAALGRKSGGRLSLRILSEALGDDDAETAPAGHAAAWQRTDEYLVLLKRLWSNDRPFDHEGAFYSIKGGYVPRKGSGDGGITIRMGGLSGTALNVVARHADVFELVPGSIDETRHLIDRVRSAAADYGRARKIRFALPVRIRETDQPPVAGGQGVELFGSAAQIALSLLPYTDLGIDEFMIGGADAHRQIRTVGRETIRLVRNSLARQDVDAIRPADVRMRSTYFALRASSSGHAGR